MTPNTLPNVDSLGSVARPKDSGSSILATPVVGNFMGVRIHSKFIRVVVRIHFGSTVHHDGFMLADALESVINIIGNLKQHLIMVTDKKLVDFTVGGRVLASVVKDDLHHTAHYDKMVDLLLMIMPSFYYPRIGRGQINLPKFDKHRLIGSQHFHEATSLIGYHS